jgi:hypothetical protein
MQEVEARLPKLKEECRLEKEEQNKLKKLEAMVSSKEKALLKAKKAAESVVTAIAEIEEQIANAGGAKMKKQRARGYFPYFDALFPVTPKFLLFRPLFQF